jgi:hypothetical protein
MRTVVFVGPSLPVRDARGLIDAEFLPPVSQGDVYRAVLSGARIIGIVDGYFERVPAVWHKEILWALSRGIHVLGASSMGALRAVELAPFGMVGIGRVFEAFARGVLEDDDEVTIVHGPEELGYPAVSEAMVNIRATLAQAEMDGIISSEVRDKMVRLGKSLYYPERNYDTIFSKAMDGGIAEHIVTELVQWLPTGRIDCKREDAVSLMREMRALQRRGVGPVEPNFHFQDTDAWTQVSRRLGHQVTAAVQHDCNLDMLLDELRLDWTLYERVVDKAFARALALREDARSPKPIPREVFRDALNYFFVRRGRLTPEDIKGWLEEEHVDADHLALLIQSEIKVARAEKFFRQEARAQIADSLRVMGIYGKYMPRATNKRDYLKEIGVENPSLGLTGLSENELLRWYFVEMRQQDVPPDLEKFSRSLGPTSYYCAE